ncbi:hypothetical protein QAD02_002836 [Eretmocerus hayati]|uniref:Uncharacterized protein n=1 Tax=Eretmocerus hayati TaxID=131215 RepID=A0ACC2NMX5_9HYME|nr:hypothetical protein QAD02_002836 [Eretmocerus hayati]
MSIRLTSQKLKRLIWVLAIRKSRRIYWEERNPERIARLSFLLRELRRREDKPKRIWVTEAFCVEERTAHGACDGYIEIIRRTDPGSFFNFLRMSPEVFDLLFSIVEPAITKQKAVREPIPAKGRLEITLRYLATGDNYETLAALFRVSPQAVSVIVNEVTSAIWSCLKPLVFEDPDEEFWLARADEFAWEWDYEHCVGAIDSKLVLIQVRKLPPHRGSLMFDYKGHHSVHPLAVVDLSHR